GALPWSRGAGRQRRSAHRARPVCTGAHVSSAPHRSQTGADPLPAFAVWVGQQRSHGDRACVSSGNRPHSPDTRPYGQPATSSPGRYLVWRQVARRRHATDVARARAGIRRSRRSGAGQLRGRAGIGYGGGSGKPRMAGMTGESSLLPISGAAWKGVGYGCTTRRGGVSTGEWGALNLGSHVGDDPEAVRENRRRLSVGLPGRPYWLEQVHGIDVVEVTATQNRYETPRADAAVTTCPGVVLAIMTADCLPVVIADIDGQAVGVAHAGW